MPQHRAADRRTVHPWAPLPSARPPELFLGADRYGPEVDMWSAGCIMYELLTGKPLFPGKDDTDQMEKIFQIMGRPTEETMPGCTSLQKCARRVGAGAGPAPDPCVEWPVARGALTAVCGRSSP